MIILLKLEFCHDGLGVLCIIAMTMFVVTGLSTLSLEPGLVLVPLDVLACRDQCYPTKVETALSLL